MKSKLNKYARKSSLMDISLKYGDETISFNLNDELKVNEARINHELKTQPSYYGFLTLLGRRLDRVEADKRAELEKVEAELLIEAKTEIDPNTNRPYNNDVAEAMVKVDEDYQKALKNYNQAKENAGIVSSCIKSFEQRSSLLQTLSANVRDEKKAI